MGLGRGWALGTTGNWTRSQPHIRGREGERACFWRRKHQQPDRSHLRCAAAAWSDSGHCPSRRRSTSAAASIVSGAIPVYTGLSNTPLAQVLVVQRATRMAHTVHKLRTVAWRRALWWQAR